MKFKLLKKYTKTGNLLIQRVLAKNQLKSAVLNPMITWGSSMVKFHLYKTQGVIKYPNLLKIRSRTQDQNRNRDPKVTKSW